MATPVLLLRPSPASAPVAITQSAAGHPATYPGAQTVEEKRSGDYPKRELAWRGMTIRVENEAGTVREGPGWQTRMVFAYGELQDTEGVDGDPVDVILGPYLEEATQVFVVHQRRVGRWSEYDEDKCMLGFLSEEEAAQAFLANYDDARFLGPITTLPVDEFVAKARATRERPSMIKSWFGDADLLKATLKKQVTIPAHYKADGTFVASYQKMVHYNPNHSLHDVAHGGVSHSQKEAHKKLVKEYGDHFHSLNTETKMALVMAHATDIQDAASASAAISGWKAAATTGKNPTGSQWAAFNALPKIKQAPLWDLVKEKVGNWNHLVQPVTSMPAGESVAKPPASPEAIVDLSDGLAKQEEDKAIAEYKGDADLAYKEGNHQGLQVLADEGVHGYPEVAAHAQKHLDNLKAKDLLEQLPKSGSHYQKEALKKVQADPAHLMKEPAAVYAQVMDLYKQLQGAASQSAAVSLWKKAMLAGKVPSPAQHAAYTALAQKDPKKTTALYNDVVAAIGGEKALDLFAAASKIDLPAPPAAPKPEPVNKTAQQMGAKVSAIPDPHAPADSPSGPGTAGGSAYDYLEKHKPYASPEKLGAEWLKNNPGKLSELHAAMQDHGYSGAVIKEAIKGAATFYPDKSAAPKVRDHGWKGDTPLPSGWDFAASDPGFQGAASITASMPDGSMFYVVPNGYGGWQAGHIDAQGDPGGHFDSGNEDDIASWLSGNLPDGDLHLTYKHVQGLMASAKAATSPPASAPAKKTADDYAQIGAKVHGLSPSGQVIKNAALYASQGKLAEIAAIVSHLPAMKQKTKDSVQAILDAAKQEHGAAAPSDALPAGWSAETGKLTFGGSGFTVHITLAANGQNWIVRKMQGQSVLSHDGGLNAEQAVKKAAAAIGSGIPPTMVNKLLDMKKPAAAKPPRIKSVKPTPAPAAQKTATAPKYTFHHTQDGHNKSWAMHVKPSANGTAVLVTEYGKIGAKQQKTEKLFPNADAAHDAAQKLKNEKVAKGYKHFDTDYLHQVLVDAPKDPSGSPAPATPKKPAFEGPSTFATAATAVEKHLAEENPHAIASELEQAYGLMSPAAQKLQQYAIASLKHLGAQKPSFVSGQDWSGPKDGDTKPAADGGTLVFKEGYWHKMAAAAVAPTKATQADVDAIMAQHYPGHTPGKVPTNQIGKDAIAAAKAGDVEALQNLIKHGNWSNKPKAKATAEMLLAHITGKPQVRAPKAPDNVTMTPAKPAKLSSDDLSALVKKLKEDWNAQGNSVSQLSLEAINNAMFHLKNGNPAGAQTVLDNVSPNAKAAKTIIPKLLAAHHGTWSYTTPPKADPHAAKPPVTSPPISGKGAGVKPGQAHPMDDWTKLSDKKGSNPGGTFKDNAGTQWYCKFPGTEDIARNEVLAAKFYQMLGAKVPFVKLVRRDGKLGIASKMIDGLKKTDAAGLAKAKGAHDGFIFDAWMGNWDVIGMSNDNLLLDKDGVAVRVDPGGALIYRAQGGKKTDFGGTVLELDSMLDPKKSPQAAAVFKGIGKDAIDAGVQTLNKLKPTQITELVQLLGPGSAAEKAKLAETLIERRAFILKKFGVVDQWSTVQKLDPTKLPVNPKDLPKPIDFVNFNGVGKGLSSKAWLNEQNTKDSAALVAFAAKGNLVALKDYKYEAVDKESGKSLGMKPITEHPSNKVQEQWAGLVELLQSINTPSLPTLDMPSLGAVSALEDISDFVGSFAPTERPETVATEHRMGFFMALNQIDDIHELVKDMKWSHITKGGAWVSKMKAGFASLSAKVRSYISSVQASGSINHVWSQGKTTANGMGVHSLSAAIYKDAVDIPEGTILRRGMSDTTAGKSMMKQLLNAKPGLVIQNTDSMCTSFNEAHSWGGDIQMTIRCAKGAKATPSFASGSFASEYEITTLPGQRYVVLGVEKSSTGIKLDVLMLPPHQGYVAELGKLSALGKALQSTILFIRKAGS